jgi:hypothetical protein
VYINARQQPPSGEKYVNFFASLGPAIEALVPRKAILS